MPTIPTGPAPPPRPPIAPTPAPAPAPAPIAPTPVPAPAPTAQPVPAVVDLKTAGLNKATKNKKYKKRQVLSKGQLNQQPDRMLLVKQKKWIDPDKKKSSRDDQHKVQQEQKRASKLEKLRMLHGEEGDGASVVSAGVSASVASSYSMVSDSDQFIDNLSHDMEQNVQQAVEYVETGGVYGAGVCTSWSDGEDDDDYDNL